MRKSVVFIFLLIPMLLLTSCVPVIKPSGDVVINVITTEEKNMWEEKDDSQKKYYSVYSNGLYQEIDAFTPDDVTEYDVDTRTFSSEIINNRIVNRVIAPIVADKNHHLVTPDDNILGIIYAAANSIHHDILTFKIIRDGDRYFAFIWLNVNWYSPCDLYEYNIADKSIHQLCDWDRVDIVGISVPKPARALQSV